MISRAISIAFFYYFIGLWCPVYSQGCAGLDADAGPDQYTCDPSIPVQLMGNFTGVPTKYYWTPTTYLSDPNILDPIVNAPVGKYKYTLTVEAVTTNNLINNGDFESGNSGFTHDYNYGTPGGPFGPGWLSVGIDPISYNGAWTNCGDHTSGTGRQLIVDGHTTPNSNIWCQTVTVTAGKMYLFQFFVQSVYPVAPANLIVRANNVNIGSVSAAGLCDWQMFEACFTATSGSVQMCIVETTTIGFGNDFTIDDIQMYEKCVETDEVEVEVVDLKAAIQVPQLPKCASDIFDLTALGSSVGSNIKYEWRSEGGKIVSQNGLAAKGQGSGKYIIKVVYKNGNVLCEKEAEIDISASDVLEGFMDVEGIANCQQDTVILRATALNGSGNFQFNWIPANKIVRGQNDSIAYVLEAGIYKVVITDKETGCETEIQEVVVSDTLKPQLQLKGDSLINCIKKQAILVGSPFDTTRYSYEWLLPDSSRIKNKDSIISNTSGTFSLRILDKTNKCHDEKSLNLRIDTLSPTIDLGPDLQIDCIQSEVDIIPLAGNLNSNTNFQWNLPSSGQIIETNLFNKKENNPGQVILRIYNTDNGCEQSDTLNIGDIRQLPFVDAGPGGTLDCMLKDLRLNGNQSKTDSCIYYWTTQTGNIISRDSILSPTIDAPGWYYFHLLDTTNNCRNSDSVFVDQNIVVPKIVVDTHYIYTCADTSLIIDASSSSQGPQYKFLWSPLSGNIVSGLGTKSIIINSAGNYQLILRDTINHCEDTANILVEPDLNIPSSTISVIDTLNCIQTSVTLMGQASSPIGNAVQFTWTAAAGQNIQNANTLNPIVTEPGEYILTVTDLVNGCISISRAYVEMDTTKPIANAGPDSTWFCNTTILTLDGIQSMGIHGLLFEWSTPNGSILSNNQLSKIDVGWPGTYNLKVTDPVNGCESTDQTVIHQDLIIPVARIVKADTINCLQAVIALSGQGSSTGNRIIYNWNTLDGNIIGPANQIDILVDRPGNYQIIVTDTVNKCKEQTSILVTEDKEYPIADAGIPIDLLCQQVDVLLTGTANGNNLRYSWITTQGNIIGKSDSLQIKVDRPGWYFLSVTNSANGCKSVDSVLVTQRNNLVVDAGVSSELTCLVKQIGLNGILQNHSGNEQLLWFTQQGNIIGAANLTNVFIDKPGWYFFSVMNPSNGCSGIDSVLITENTNVPTALELEIEQPKCPGDLWLAEIKNISGGEMPIQIYLNQLLNPRFQLQGSVYGNQAIRIVDKNGCELNHSFNIITPQAVAVQLTPVVKLTSGSDYNLLPQYSVPDDSIASVNWSPGDFLDCTNCKYPVINNITRDVEYFVSFTNHAGCSASARIRVEVIKRNIWVPNSFSPNGDNINDHFYPHVTEDSYNEIRLLQIYDRWGNQVFSKEHLPPNDPGSGWNGDCNGQHMNPGTYIYIIEIEWKNGETQKLYGDLTLMR